MKKITYFLLAIGLLIIVSVTYSFLYLKFTNAISFEIIECSIKSNQLSGSLVEKGYKLNSCFSTEHESVRIVENGDYEMGIWEISSYGNISSDRMLVETIPNLKDLVVNPSREIKWGKNSITFLARAQPLAADSLIFQLAENAGILEYKKANGLLFLNVISKGVTISNSKPEIQQLLSSSNAINFQLLVEKKSTSLVFHFLVSKKTPDKINDSFYLSNLLKNQIDIPHSWGDAQPMKEVN